MSLEFYFLAAASIINRLVMLVGQNGILGITTFCCIFICCHSRPSISYWFILEIVGIWDLGTRQAHEHK